MGWPCQSRILPPLLLSLCPCRSWCSLGGSDCAWGTVSLPVLPTVTPLPALPFAAWPFLPLPKVSAGRAGLHPASSLQPVSHRGLRATCRVAASRELNLPWLKSGTHPKVSVASPECPPSLLAGDCASASPGKSTCSSISPGAAAFIRGMVAVLLPVSLLRVFQRRRSPIRVPRHRVTRVLDGTGLPAPSLPLGKHDPLPTPLQETWGWRPALGSCQEDPGN